MKQDEMKQEPAAWAKRAAEWLLDLPNTRYDAPYFTNGMFKGDCLELADLLQKLTHPQPKREWVGLTDEALVAVAQSCLSPHQYEHFEALLENDLDAHNRLARAIEAKLKQKNGYAEEKNT